MKIRLDELPEHFTEADAKLFDDAFEAFGENAKTSNEQHRILSRVMRKAGYDMKRDGGVKRTRKSKKRIVMILIAAAALLIGALGAAAYYNNNKVRSGMKWLFGGGEDSDAAALDGITSHEGRLTKNSFEELDIEFSGAICDNEDMYAVFTISKKDGTEFTLPEGYEWRVGFSDVSHYRFGKAYRTIKSTHSFHMQLNDDGTLSATIRGTEVYEPNQKKHDYMFAFTNIYCVPEHVFFERENGDFSEIYWLANEMRESFESEGNKGYEESKEKYFSAMQSVSVQSMEGAAECVVDHESLRSEIPSYEFEYRNLTAVVDITPIKLKVHAEDADWDIKTYYTEQTMEIFYKDGTADELECTSRYCGGNASEWSWYLDYAGDKPIDVSKIGYIMFDGVRIDIDN